MKKNKPHLYNKEIDGELIPVHINICRNKTHFFTWSPTLKEWVKGEPISENLNRHYNSPTPNLNNYK